MGILFVVVGDPVLYVQCTNSFLFALLVPQGHLVVQAILVSISHNSASMQPKLHSDRSCDLWETVYYIKAVVGNILCVCVVRQKFHDNISTLL